MSKSKLVLLLVSMGLCLALSSTPYAEAPSAVQSNLMGMLNALLALLAWTPMTPIPIAVLP